MVAGSFVQFLECSTDSLVDRHGAAGEGFRMPVLDWIGKKAVVNHHREVPYRLPHCDKAKSVGDPDAGNPLVQGDNLEARLLYSKPQPVRIRGADGEYCVFPGGTSISCVRPNLPPTFVSKRSKRR